MKLNRILLCSLVALVLTSSVLVIAQVNRHSKTALFGASLLSG